MRALIGFVVGAILCSNLGAQTATLPAAPAARPFPPLAKVSRRVQPGKLATDQLKAVNRELLSSPAALLGNFFLCKPYCEEVGTVTRKARQGKNVDLAEIKILRDVKELTEVIFLPASSLIWKKLYTDWIPEATRLAQAEEAQKVAAEKLATEQAAAAALAAELAANAPREIRPLALIYSLNFAPAYGYRHIKSSEPGTYDMAGNKGSYNQQLGANVGLIRNEKWYASLGLSYDFAPREGSERGRTNSSTETLFGLAIGRRWSETFRTQIGFDYDVFVHKVSPEDQSAFANEIHTTNLVLGAQWRFLEANFKYALKGTSVDYDLYRGRLKKLTAWQLELAGRFYQHEILRSNVLSLWAGTDYLSIKEIHGGARSASGTALPGTNDFTTKQTSQNFWVGARVGLD